MPRPPRYRRMYTPPSIKGFKPFGVPVNDLEYVRMLFEEYESINLADYQGLNQEEASKKMNISRPTFTRIYEKARKIVAQAFVEGKALVIEGGNVKFDCEWFKCLACNKMYRSNDKKTPETCNECGSRKFEAINQTLKKISDRNELNENFKIEQAEGFCICIDCELKFPHTPNVPCRELHCPKCGKKLLRENSVHHQLIIEQRNKGKSLQ